jgi:7-cyano-7-deazaguanine reductase
MLSQPQDLAALGSATGYVYTGADPALLERFPNPLKGAGQGTVNIVAPEFTSLCPLTGQPDFATIVVDYTPRDWCVESKAWKLYLGSYRQVGEFHEACVRRIANDLLRLLDPLHLEIRGEFTPRGGIPFWPSIRYHRPFVAFDLDLVESRPIVGNESDNESQARVVKNGELVGFAQFSKSGDELFGDLDMTKVQIHEFTPL